MQWGASKKAYTLPSPTKTTVRLGSDSLTAKQAPSAAPMINRKLCRRISSLAHTSQLTDSPSNASPSHLGQQVRALWQAYIDYSILRSACGGKIFYKSVEVEVNGNSMMSKVLCDIPVSARMTSFNLKN